MTLHESLRYAAARPQATRGAAFLAKSQGAVRLTPIHTAADPRGLCAASSTLAESLGIQSPTLFDEEGSPT